MSAASYVELAAVVANRAAPEQHRRVDRLLDRLGVVVVPLTADHARVAAPWVTASVGPTCGSRCRPPDPTRPAAALAPSSRTPYVRIQHIS
jgi:hypothetical protein